MQAAAAHTAEQQTLNTEVSRLREDKARLHTQAQRVAGLEEQLHAATGLANADASQVRTHKLPWLSCCNPFFESRLLFPCVPKFFH